MITSVILPLMTQIFFFFSNNEIVALFTGYGYQVRIVGNDLGRIQEDMAASMDWAYEEVKVTVIII